MNRYILSLLPAIVLMAAGYTAADASRPDSTASANAGHSYLPSPSAAKTVLNATERHREWVNIPAGSSHIRAFIVYPGRSDKGPVVLVTADRQGASDWIRAVGDQLAASGYIAAVPDVLSGLGPNGGDTDSFRNPDDIAAALDRLGPAEVARRKQAVLQYAVTLPAANGRTAAMEFYSGSAAHVDAAVDSASPGSRTTARFALTNEAWPGALKFLDKQTGNQPAFGMNPNAPEDHSAHMHMMMAQNNAPGAGRGGQPGRGRGAAGYPMGKLPDLPAGLYTARTTLTNSRLRKEFVDIPVGDVRLHTWVEYPEGEGKAPVVLIMQHGPGMDEWQRSIADQAALQGFIGVAPDLESGLGPNGGNYDSFSGPDDALRAMGRLTQDEMMRRLRAARDWAIKLPRYSGKYATLGFCMGGGLSMRFAAEDPEPSAAVSFYGNPIDRAAAAKVKAPILAFYGDEDERVTASMAPLQALMKELGKSFEPHVYPHATHGFVSLQDVTGNGEATADSWPRTIAFIKQYTK